MGGGGGGGGGGGAIEVIRDNVFKNEPSKICGRQPLKIFEGIWAVF